MPAAETRQAPLNARPSWKGAHGKRVPDYQSLGQLAMRSQVSKIVFISQQGIIILQDTEHYFRLEKTAQWVSRAEAYKEITAQFNGSP